MRERIRIHRSKSASVEQETPKLQQFSETLDRHGPGKSLTAAEQSFLRAGTGHEFGQVRVHADAEADQLSRAVNARAFTAGQDIFFRAGAYDPTTAEGTRLLAHEAAHTVQERGGEARHGAQAPITVSQPTDHAEIEADAAAAALTSGQRVPALASTAGYKSNAVIHRDDAEKPELDPPENAKKAAEGASAPPNPMIIGMFKTGVVAQIDAAHANLGEKAPNIPGATTHLSGAAEVLHSMADSARTDGNEALAANCSNARNILAAEGVALDAHIGIKVPLSDIRDNLDTANQERIGMTMNRIEGML
jgi:hypothetical protein